ncbi:GntR family transcriptional regulator [Roseicyclus sp.]|uniref:GntR family transcriptional regulator n=1 Tax=Roseicyclus sp. TaxID=1914329 RepID=UPI003F6CBDE3
MSERIADHLRELLEQAILTGEFANGERLDEARLCERYAVSRTPIRETFQRLAGSGLIELVPHRGAFVRYPAFDEVVEMFEVMAELEAFCGRLAARRVTDALLAQIDQTVAACEVSAAEGDADSYYRENERFHHLIYEASGNGFLAAEAARLHRRLQPFRRMQLRLRGRLRQSLDEHRRIAEALRNGNSDVAAATLSAHVSVQGERFNDLMASYRSSVQRRA